MEILTSPEEAPVATIVLAMAVMMQAGRYVFTTTFAATLYRMKSRHNILATSAGLNVAAVWRIIDKE